MSNFQKTNLRIYEVELHASVYPYSKVALQKQSLNVICLSTLVHLFLSMKTRKQYIICTFDMNEFIKTKL